MAILTLMRRAGQKAPFRQTRNVAVATMPADTKKLRTWTDGDVLVDEASILGDRPKLRDACAVIRTRKRHINFEHINFFKAWTALGQPAG